MKPILAAAVAFLLVPATSARPASAEVFVLAGGGRIVGELVNRDESRPKQYVIQVADGAQGHARCEAGRTGPPPASR